MSLITNIFGLAGQADALTKARTKLRETVSQNEADKLWATSFRQRALDYKSKLDSLLESFTANPTDKLANEILALAEKSEAQAPILDKLSETAKPPVAARILARTKPALRDCLEVIRQRLEVELAESKARAAAFSKDSSHRVGGVVNTGWKNEAELASAVISPATAALERTLEKCAGYLSRLDGATNSNLHGMLEFVLDET